MPIHPYYEQFKKKQGPIANLLLNYIKNYYAPFSEDTHSNMGHTLTLEQLLNAVDDREGKLHPNPCRAPIKLNQIEH